MKNSLSIFLLLLQLVCITNIFARGKKETLDDSVSWAIKRDGQVPEINVSSVKGNILIAGSSTVFPIAEKLAEIFREDGYTDNIKVDSIGSGAGFERWTKGETDISNTSRPIKSEEVTTAQSIGRDPIEFLVGIDALVVVVSPKNDWVKDLSLGTVAKIFSSDKWSDLNPNWPNKAIEKFSPGTDSGTFDFFVEVVFHNDKEQLLSANSLQLSEDDNILSRGVQSSKYGIGYFGYAYYEEASDTLKALSIEGAIPNEENIFNNTYPLARPLYMYSAASIMREKTQVAAFLAYTLNNVESIITEVGYFPARKEDYNVSSESWLAAMDGKF